MHHTNGIWAAVEELILNTRKYNQNIVNAGKLEFKAVKSNVSKYMMYQV